MGGRLEGLGTQVATGNGGAWPLLVAVLGGLALGAVILLGLAVAARRQQRRGQPITPGGLTVHVDPARATGAGRLIAVGLVLLALVTAAGSADPHRGRVFFGFLLVEGLLMAVYAFFFTSNSPLPDINAEEFARMSFLERHAALKGYGAGGAAMALRVASRLVLPISACGLAAALIFNW